MSRTDPAIEFTENLSGMFQPQPEEAHPLQIPDIKVAFGNAHGSREYGSTPVADMGPNMQQTLSSVMMPNPIRLDMDGINLNSATLHEKPEGIKAPAQSSIGELFGHGMDMAREAIDKINPTTELEMKPAPLIQNNFSAPRFGGVF